MRKNKYAFSILELIVTFIIIVCIVAAFVSILTKKASKVKVIPVANKTAPKVILLTSESANKKENYYSCSSVEKDEVTNVRSLKCKLKNLPSKINAILVAGGASGAGAVSGDVVLETKNFFSSGNNKSINSVLITKNMKDIKVSLYASGGSGGGGVYNSINASNEQYITKCNEYNSVFIPKELNGANKKNLCVTRRNAGDYDGPSIVSSVKLYTPSFFDSALENPMACIGRKSASEVGLAYRVSSILYDDYGNPYSGCTEDAQASGGYSGCYRTVCTYKAAEQICSNYAILDTNPGDWRLPNLSEFQGWYQNAHSVTFSKGADGLQLCRDSLFINEKDSLTLNEAAECGSMTEAPYMMFASKIEINNIVQVSFPVVPSTLWGETYSNDFNPQLMLFSDGFYDDGSSFSTSTTFASARCVKEINLLSHFAYAGGGGSAGSFVLDKSIPLDVIKNCTDNELNCSIDFNVAPYQSDVGMGGLKTNAKDGLDGKPTSVIVKSGSSILWGYKVKGGTGGKKAILSDSGAETALIMQCSQYNGANWSDWEECPTLNSANYSGKSGKTPTLNGSTTFLQAKGGDGGKGINLNGVIYGAGGAGGSVLNKTCTDDDLKGGVSSEGLAKLTYKMQYNGAPGGGGGGGAFSKITEISVPSNGEIDVQVGLGGLVIENSEGINGGNSAISDKYVVYGGLGGKKGISASILKDAIAGFGGEGGSFFPASMKNASNGTSGSNGEIVSNNINTQGGLGGQSGISVTKNIIDLSKTSACGGNKDNSKICYDSFNARTTYKGHHFDFVKPSLELYQNNNYGSAGQGGGGGAWGLKDGVLQIGPGGKGNDGYIYIWW